MTDKNYLKNTNGLTDGFLSYMIIKSINKKSDSNSTFVYSSTVSNQLFFKILNTVYIATEKLMI